MYVYAYLLLYTGADPHTYTYIYAGIEASAKALIVDALLSLYSYILIYVYMYLLLHIGADPHTLFMQA